HLFRIDVSELGDDIDSAVNEFAIIEKKMKKLRNSIRRSVTLGSPELADVAGALDDELENAEERQYHAIDGLFFFFDLRASLTEAQISMLFERQVADGKASDEGDLASMDSAARSSILAGHSSITAAASGNVRRRPTVAEIVANLQSRMSTAGLNASMLLNESGNLGHLAPWFPLNAPASQSVGEASLRSGTGSVDALNIENVVDGNGDAAARRTKAILPPIRSVAKETAAARSTMFGDVATIAAEIAAARNKVASEALQVTDEQRILNLKTCLAVLDNAQKQYAKSKGISLPPLDSLPPIDEESEIGRPVARGTGGAMTGKLWRATVQRQAEEAAEARRKRKQSVKLSVKASPAPKR
ncbi:Hypothetical protein, putative, partial [Bodo saltans]